MQTCYHKKTHFASGRTESQSGFFRRAKEV